MPVLHCSITGCAYATDDVEIVGAAALINLHAMEHAPGAAGARIKLEPPIVSTGTSAEDWESFCRLWKSYRDGMNIPVNQRSTHLFHCCDKELKIDILKNNPAEITTVTEENLLKEIKKLAVKTESVLLHRIKMWKMMQGPGTGIHNFHAQLKGHAKLCEYSVNCTCTLKVDYSEEMSKDHLIRGLNDPEILADLLGDPDTCLLYTSPSPRDS